MFPDGDISSYFSIVLLLNRPILGNVLRSKIERIYLGSNSRAPITFNTFSDVWHPCVVYSLMWGCMVDSRVPHVITFRQLLIPLQELTSSSCPYKATVSDGLNQSLHTHPSVDVTQKPFKDIADCVTSHCAETSWKSWSAHGVYKLMEGFDPSLLPYC